MITIIDFGKPEHENIKRALAELSVDAVVSAAEADILKADKLILPDCGNVKFAIRKLHLLNLFSVLRIIKKPLLGIGTGMHLLTDSFKDENLACLGCFPAKCFGVDIPGLNYGTNLRIIKKTESPLLNNINKDAEFYFKTYCCIPVNEFSTSSAKVDEFEFTATMEKDDYYGMQFLPGQSGEAGLTVLRNFVEM